VESCGMQTKLIVFSTSGMGKGSCDGENGLNNKALTAFRRTGPSQPFSNQSTAAEVSRAINGAGRIGQLAFCREVYDMGNQLCNKAGQDISRFHELWVQRGIEGDFELWGKHHSGVGTGVRILLDNHTPEAIAALEGAMAKEPIGEPPVVYPPVCDRLYLRQDRKRAREADLQRAKETRAANQPSVTTEQTQRTDARAQLLATAEADTNDIVLICPKCRQGFDATRKARFYNEHIAKCTGRTERLRVPEEAKKLVGAVCTEREEQGKRESIVVSVAMESREQLDSELQLVAHGGECVVRKVLSTCARVRVHARVPPGCTLVSVSPDAAAQATEAAAPGDMLEAIQGTTFPALLTFCLPRPPVPPRGWAAKIPQALRFKPCTKVEDFLTEQYEKNNKVTARKLEELLTLHFPGEEEIHHLAVDIQKRLKTFWRTTADAKKAAEAAL
jgi:hypothetical protein